MPATDKTDNAVTKPNETGKRSNVGYIINLVFGDALVFCIFAYIGRGSHSEATGLAAIPDTLLTALPFALGWFIVAPFIGVYRRQLEARPRAMAIRTLRAWILSWPVSMALRWLFVDRTKAGLTFTSFLTFALVTFFTVLILLLIWRWPFAWYNGVKQREGRL